MWQRIDDIVLWNNPGTANITINNGAVQWFTNNGISGTDFSLQPSYWYEIPVLNVDYLFLQFSAKTESIGTITNVNSSTLALALQGMLHTEDAEPFNKPHAVRATRTPTGDHGDPEFSAFPVFSNSLSIGKPVGTAGWSNVTANAGTEHQRGAIFLLGSTSPRLPTTSDRPGWLINVGARTSHNTNDIGNDTQGGFSAYKRISGYSKVWVAFSMFNDFVGAGPIRVKGKIVAIRYIERPGSLR